MMIDLSGVDWPLLRDQKQVMLRVIDTVFDMEKEALTGILHLLDHLQDEAEKRGVPTADLFPPDPDDETDDN